MLLLTSQCLLTPVNRTKSMFQKSRLQTHIRTRITHINCLPHVHNRFTVGGRHSQAGSPTCTSSISFWVQGAHVLNCSVPGYSLILPEGPSKWFWTWTCWLAVTNHRTETCVYKLYPLQQSSCFFSLQREETARSVSKHSTYYTHYTC